MRAEPEFVYSIRDEAVKLRPQPSRPQSSRRARSDGQPPANAQVCYKAVATAPDGRMYAIFDGQTEYKLQTTTHAPTGLWVCPSIFAACVHARRLPSFSAALDWPRVMLRCLAWEERDGETWPLPPPRPGAQKLRATHVVPLAVLPYSALSDYGRPSGSAWASADAIVSTPRGGRPRTAPAARPATAAPGAWRRFGGYQKSEALQAQTVALVEDIAEMEATLATVARTRADAKHLAQSQPSGWVARALERENLGKSNEPELPYSSRADELEFTGLAYARSLGLLRREEPTSEALMRDVTDVAGATSGTFAQFRRDVAVGA